MCICLIIYVLEYYTDTRTHIWAVRHMLIKDIVHVCFQKREGVVAVERKKLLVLGGDLRIVALANRFAEDGFDVVTYGFDESVAFLPSVCRAADLDSALQERDIVIAGLPITNDDITVRTPLYQGKIYFYELFKKMRKNQWLMGGKITRKIQNLGTIYNVPIVDYFEREELTVLNAIPTAEGAVELAMRELPITIHGSCALVLGFGRVGKVLARTLAALGAETYVEARKFSDLSWIACYGYHGVYLPDLEETLGRYDMVFNTIPHEILTRERMEKLRKDCLVVDLASAPGGVDLEAAQKTGLKAVSALSLPGKVAPQTAGEIIGRTIINIISDLGV